MRRRAGYIEVLQQRQLVWTSKNYKLRKTSYPKLRNLALCGVWEDARVWPHGTHSFDRHFSSLGPESCTFTPWGSSGLPVGSGCGLRATRWQVFWASWVPSGLTSSPFMVAAITDDWDILCLLICQEIFHFSRQNYRQADNHQLPEIAEGGLEWTGGTHYFRATNLFCMGFPGGSAIKNLPANAEDSGLIPRSRRSPREGNGDPLQYSCWIIPRTEEPGRLQSTESQRARYDLATKQQQIILHTIMVARRHHVFAKFIECTTQRIS